MAERPSFIDRVKGAERACYVDAAAVKHYGQAVQASDAQLPDKTSPRDLVTAADKAESTYIIRMWAEFETAPRSYRRHITGVPDDRLSTSNLINWTAGVRRGRAIPEDVRDDFHELQMPIPPTQCLMAASMSSHCGDGCLLATITLT
jgi:hypothetical protein